LKHTSVKHIPHTPHDPVSTEMFLLLRLLAVDP